MFRLEFLETSSLNDEIYGASLGYVYINKEYTNFLLALKYLFFIVSLVNATVYWIKLRKLYRRHWVIE